RAMGVDSGGCGIRAPDGRDRAADRGMAARAERRASGPAVRARARERRQRGGRGDGRGAREHAFRAGGARGDRGGARGRGAWQESADSVWATREEDGLWTNRLYGESFHSLTPPHGLVGNVLALRPDARREQLERETAEVLARLVVRDDGLANWPRRQGSFKL